MIQLTTDGRIAYEEWRDVLQVGGERMFRDVTPERRPQDPKGQVQVRAKSAGPPLAVKDIAAVFETEEDPVEVAKRYQTFREAKMRSTRDSLLAGSSGLEEFG